MTDKAPHLPVLLAEVVEVLSPRDGGLYVDGTFGAGGYSRAILEAADCSVYGIDQDPTAIESGATLAREFDGRLTLLHGRFADMETLLDEVGISQVDGIALDVGVSSMQIDQAERGFSFQQDGPLDMRMSREGVSAADIVNTYAQAELIHILSVYGEERRSRLIALAIIKARDEKPIERTSELAAIVEKAIGRKPGARIHPATRTFQGLRICVNNELEQLKDALIASEKLLRPSGRLAVVSFHSLEDRLVKQFLNQRSGNRPSASRHLPLETKTFPDSSFNLLKKGAIKPSRQEMDANPRARSARLRAAERCSTPIWDAQYNDQLRVV